MRPALSRLVTAAAVALALSTLAGPALAQVPLPTELPTLPGEPSEEPTEPPAAPAPAPSEEPSPAPQPSPSPTQEPDPTVADQQSEAPSDTPTGGQGSLPGFDVFAPTTGQTAPDAGAPAPEVAPGRDGAPTGGSGPTGDGVVVVAGVDRVAAALPGTFGIGLLAALLGVATIFTTFNLTQRGLLLATDADGGTDVETTRRWRVMAGVALLAAAALVGILGYLKISLETLVPVQVVYLASAGFGVIVLAAAGGALLISEQLRADESRLTEIEAALATIASHLTPAVADAPRLLDRDDDATSEA